MNTGSPLSISDDSIAGLLCDDDHVQEAIRLIMNKYGEKLYWHIRRIVVGHDDAEDVLQEAMINVFKYRNTYSRDYPLSSWLYKIASNESLKMLKSRVGFFQSLDDLGDSLKNSVRAEASPDADETLILLQEAISLLPTKQKLVFNLRYYDDKSYEEIHQILGDSVNTLKTNYHYAAEKIKEYLKEHYMKNLKTWKRDCRMHAGAFHGEDERKNHCRFETPLERKTAQFYIGFSLLWCCCMAMLFASIGAGSLVYRHYESIFDARA